MEYKVCILAGGSAPQMGELTKNINASVLPVNFKGTISYIIDKFPENVEIIVIVGYKKDTVLDYLSIAHPERKFTIVESDKYIGPGTGPGYGLLQCKNKLQCPFIVVTSDTIVLEDIPEPNENWFGIAPVKETERFCTIKMKNNLIFQIDDKIKCDNKHAFIGLAGIKNYEDFWNAMENNTETIKGEIQLSNGFKKLIEKRLIPKGFTWFDTGSIEGYKETSINFHGNESKFDFSKNNEFLYFINNRVIKFFADSEIARKRVERAKDLGSLVPVIEKFQGNFYSYKKIDGQVLYSVLNSQLATDFFQWSKMNLWKKMDLSEPEKNEFLKSTKKFYYDKTMNRLESFYKKTDIDDSQNNINGLQVPSLSELLNKVDWDNLYNGIPSLFHGDLQFDNILVSKDERNFLPKFTLLDWRQDFGGETKCGDLYYDLGKLYGGMTISYQLIKNGQFEFYMGGSSVHYRYSVTNDLIEARVEFESFLKRNGFDLNKVKTIAALIFLNMSPLHHDPFDKMIYFMGKALLYKTLKSGDNYDY